MLAPSVPLRFLYNASSINQKQDRVQDCFLAFSLFFQVSRWVPLSFSRKSPEYQRIRVFITTIRTADDIFQMEMRSGDIARCAD